MNERLATEFNVQHKLTINGFLREMFLDPSECENGSYLLPQLGRDSFERKGVFYRVDKVVIDNYLSSFQMPSAMKAKNILTQC